MVEITLLNEYGKRFTVIKNSPYLARLFLNKVKRSKKLTLISVINV